MIGSVVGKNQLPVVVEAHEAAAGRVVYDRVMAEGTNRQIPTEWLGTDLGALYEAGFRPSP